METQKGPKKTTVPVEGGYMGFHVSLGECRASRGSADLSRHVSSYSSA